MKRLFNRIAAASGRRPWWVIAAIALVTLVAILGSFHIETEFSQRALLPEGYDSISTMKKVEQEFGGFEYAKVLLTGKDFTSPKNARYIYKYAEELKASTDPRLWGDYVLRVDSYLSPLARNPQVEPLLRSSDFLSDTGLAMTVKQYLTSPGGGFVVGKTISTDGESALINVQIRSDLPSDKSLRYAGELKNFTVSFFQSKGIDAQITGQTFLMKDVEAMAMRDMAILGIVALLFIILVLFLNFHNALDVILTLGVVIVSTLWVFGLMGFIGVKFTLASVAIIPLMLGINIAYSIHILTRYYEEREKGTDAQGSAIASVITVGVAVFMAAATTMFGFLSFSISDLPPLRDFGLLCLAGVFFGFTLSISLLPAALVIRDRHCGIIENKRKEGHCLLDWMDRGLARLSLLAERHRGIVWIMASILVVISIILASGLSTSADFRSFIPRDLPAYRALTSTEEKFGGQDMAVVRVEGENLLDPESLHCMDRFISRVLSDPRNLTPEGEGRYFKVGKVNSIPSLLKGVAGDLPSSREEAEATLAKVREEYGLDTSALITADHTRSLIAFEVLFENEAGEREMAAILKDCAAEVSSYAPLSLSLTGMPLIVSDALGKLFSTQLETGGLALLLCALLVITIFHSIYYGLAATSVVFLAVAFELGILRLIGWPLDIMTVLIASLVIGAGIDFGIHVAHRFREEVYENGLGPEEAINATVRNMGPALIPAAFTTCGAFIILAISSLTPLRRFGAITALSLGSALFAALAIAPTFLASIAIREGKGRLPSSETSVRGRSARVSLREGATISPDSKSHLDSGSRESGGGGDALTMGGPFPEGGGR